MIGRLPREDSQRISNVSDVTAGLGLKAAAKARL
jgi:hypothetical protein